MATKNLSLEIVPDSDFVSPDDFNRNFEKIDAVGLDYIVSAGVSGQWWFRKWKSGRAECGIDYKEFGTKTLNAWGSGAANIYSTQAMSFGAYPFSFAARPFCIISFENDKLLTGRASWICQHNSTSVTMSPSFMMIDASSGTCSPCCGILVEGRYK